MRWVAGQRPQKPVEMHLALRLVGQDQVTEVGWVEGAAEYANAHGGKYIAKETWLLWGTRSLLRSLSAVLLLEFLHERRQGLDSGQVEGVIDRGAHPAHRAVAL